MSIQLTTDYLGLKLRSPLMTGASPMSDRLDFLRRLEDGGAAAVVLRSLFEEQIELEERAFDVHIQSHAASSPEASRGLLPSFDDYIFDSERYLEHIRKAREALGIPVIGSLNGVSPGGWERYARSMEQAGAHAIELNFYELPTDPSRTSSELEAQYLEVLRAIRAQVRIPLAVKLSPFFSSLPHFAARLAEAGAGGIVLFNRLYEPDIDVEKLQAVPRLALSDSGELPLRLRWLGILEPHFPKHMAAAGGVHSVTDVVKTLMAGATAVQLVSAIMRNGPEHFARLEQQLRSWLEEHEYESLEQLRGSMSLRTCPDPGAFGRANYMKILHGWDLGMLGR